MDPHLAQPSAPIDDGSHPKYSKKQTVYTTTGSAVDLLFLHHIDGIDIWFDPTEGIFYPYLLDQGIADGSWPCYASGLQSPDTPAQSFIYAHRALVRGAHERLLLIPDEFNELMTKL